MAHAMKRTTVDLSEYPDLVVIYLGMRVEEPRGYATLQALGPQIQAAVEEQPDGLLLHEQSPMPRSRCTRACGSTGATSTRSRPGRSRCRTRQWWTDYLRDRGGTSFWHETYFRRGGFESMYVTVDDPVGMARFAPGAPAQGPMFSARQRRDADRSSAVG